MSDAPVVRRARRAPPRIDESKVSQPLQDLFNGWRESLKEPFKGITADGAVESGLFPLRTTGTSTAPLVDAVRAFLASLDDAQRRAVTFDVDGEVWRTWSNIHRNLMRHGLCLVELSEAQRERAYGVMRAGLGARAYETARNAMRLNETLAELTGLPDEFGDQFYWISIFGTPSPDRPWGWQMDGHHCNINCFVLRDQIVLSPMLLGSEPVTAEAGVYAGVTVLREEEAEGWAFMNALSPEQRACTLVGTELPFDGYASGFKDNIVVPYIGLPTAEMSGEQRERLKRLIALYTDRLQPSHASQRLDEVIAHFDRTVFGWIGECDPVSPFYYRIYNPVIFIEFYHQPGVALPNTGYNRRHAHALVRTPNGNDYGRALLREFREARAR
ncbi:MAG TPA: DUF3500 domain-containing protein [Pseudolabrys sp.]|uniref:DUF3500 domain-containing protein n=1 Tax=Pseudolabrys sp. TaxID=1960880 RepID=UPI002DDD00B0|nr:DUF3500 domain-containing protein [Pseudolabrys sp.]HEV2630922.1 DUF3500 domain-containing protein [Pseudolabrys sp.]